MSTLFDFRVIGVDRDTARVRAVACHPDQHEIPATRNFAQDGSRDGSWIRARPQLAALLEPWRELAHGRSVTITRAELEDLAAHRASREGLSMFGETNEVCRKQYRPEYGLFRQLAERVVQDVRRRSFSR